MGDEKSLAHTRWNCKYHIVFAPKYRRPAFYGEQLQGDRHLSQVRKSVRILNRVPRDHIHMLVEILQSVRAYPALWDI